jgi:hypothetical protein
LSNGNDSNGAAVPTGRGSFAGVVTGHVGDVQPVAPLVPHRKIGGMSLMAPNQRARAALQPSFEIYDHDQPLE